MFILRNVRRSLDKRGYTEFKLQLDVSKMYTPQEYEVLTIFVAARMPKMEMVDTREVHTSELEEAMSTQEAAQHS